MIRFHWHTAGSQLLIFSALALVAGCSGGRYVPSPPPDANQQRVITRTHGDELVDDYAWLRDKSNPEVIEYLVAENKYADDVTADQDELRSVLYKEMVGRIQEDDADVPYEKDGYWYYARTEEGKPYEIHCRRKGDMEATEEVILDVNLRAADGDYCSIEQMSVSPNGHMLAWLEDRSGYERCDLFVKDLRTGQVIDSGISELEPYSLVWANDNETIFYGRQDETNRGDRIYRHRVGTNESEDVLVYHDPDGRFFVWIERSRSGEWLIITSESQITSEQHVLSADTPNGSFQMIEPRRHGVEYSIAHCGDTFFIRTNDSAKNFRVVQAPTATPGKEHWEDVITHDPNVYLLGIDAFKDHLVVTQRTGGYQGLRVLNLQTNTDQALSMPEYVSTARADVNENFDTDRFRFGYTSMVTPPSIYEVDLNTDDRVLLKQRAVLGGYAPSDYETKRITVTGNDGTAIPVSLVYRQGVTPNGKNPVLLYGYGAYGSSMDPYFSSNRLSLLDRGVVFAMAHIRGGGEMGRSWYEDGKFLKKKNTFEDFIACAEGLVELGWADPNRIAIEGGSAGGLLIGAVINMRPELFRVALAEVPFVDVMNTMLDPTIPLTVVEYDEWGDPNDPTFYSYMKSYSPYDNVTAQAYPTLLVTAGLNDPRVHYWEPAKWVARLRDDSTSDNLLVLRTNMGAGHGGASGRYDRLQEIAFEQAFILHELDATDLMNDK